MAEKINSYCCICGKGYHLCLPCENTKKLSPWKTYTDTSEHYKIFQILHGLTTEIYTEDEAKEKLKSVDLSDLENLRVDIKDRIKNILGVSNDKTIKKNKSSKMETDK